MHGLDGANHRALQRLAAAVDGVLDRVRQQLGRHVHGRIAAAVAVGHEDPKRVLAANGCLACAEAVLALDGLLMRAAVVEHARRRRVRVTSICVACDDHLPPRVDSPRQICAARASLSPLTVRAAPARLTRRGLTEAHKLVVASNW